MPLPLSLFLSLSPLLSLSLCVYHLCLSLPVFSSLSTPFPAIVSVASSIFVFVCMFAVLVVCYFPFFCLFRLLSISLTTLLLIFFVRIRARCFCKICSVH